ncbi:MarR family winged helix-turn-helix transcriptional regulator [Alteromonas sp. CYL-A6]|uniref:MarR family winged helix-turn-helix transcriptional regulator n=1 Tax=Alteromonas nitratireducens TaxID=3390813 RepID=UPI0034AE754A
MTARTTLKLEEFVPYRTVRLAGKMSQAVSSVYRERFDLSIPQWRILATLADQPDLSAQQIAQCTGMDKVKVSRAVQSLLHRDLIARKQTSEDKRAYRIALTGEGQLLYQRIMPLAQAWQDRLLAVLDDAEKQALLSAMDKLEQVLDSTPMP